MEELYIVGHLSIYYLLPFHNIIQVATLLCGEVNFMDQNAYSSPPPAAFHLKQTLIKVENGGVIHNYYKSEFNLCPDSSVGKIICTSCSGDHAFLTTQSFFPQELLHTLCNNYSY